MQLAPANSNAARELVRNLSDLRGTIERYDANLERWQYTGNTYPSRSLVADFDQLAERFDAARFQLRDLRPDAVQVSDRLGNDALYMARLAGKMDVMQQNGTVFGRGWGSALDSVVNDVRAAADLVLASI